MQKDHTYANMMNRVSFMPTEVSTAKQSSVINNSLTGSPVINFADKKS